MATPQTHYRSISFPSRLHPTSFESHLNNLKSCDQINTASSGSNIQSGFVDLAELYNSVQKLTQSVSHQDATKTIEQSLSTSLELLDACTAIRELFQMMRENIQALQSAIRRKGPEYSGVQNDVASYFASRKRMNKCAAKTLKTLKSLENKNVVGSDNIGNNNNESFSRVLREVTGLTIAVFKSTLVYLSWRPAGKSGGWNLVSRLMMAKSTDRDDSRVFSEVGCVDTILNTLRNGDVVDVQMVKESLQNVDDCVEGIEEGLQRLFRQLLQCRVALLNVLTHH